MRAWFGRLALISLSLVVPGQLPGLIPAVEATVLSLSQEEVAYLGVLGEVRTCVDPDWIPFEHLDSEGNYTGIAAELVDLISRRLGIPFVIVPTTNWEETLASSRAGDCLVIPFLNQTPAREEWLVFTEPVLVDPNVFITREEHPYISNPGDLFDKTIVLPVGTGIEEYVRRDFPNLVVVNTESEADAFEMVQKGEADMTLRSLMMAAYTIRKKGYFRLKISGEAPEYTNYLRMGILRDKEPLRDILDKAIATITPREREEIINRYVYVRMDAPIDSRMVFGIGLAFLAITLGVFTLLLYRQRRRLEAEVFHRTRDLAESEARFKALTLNSAAGIFIMRDARFIQVNPALSEISGYPEEELTRSESLRFVHPDHRSMVRQRMSARIRGEDPPARYETRILTRGGQTRWVEVTAGLTTFEGVVSTVGTIYDITERKELQRRLEEKGNLQELIAEIFAGFINVTIDDIDDKIDVMLRQCGRFFAVDRTFLFQLSHDERFLSNTHEWCHEGVVPFKEAIQDHPVAGVPWMAEIMRTRDIRFVPDVEGLPEGPEKEELKRQHVRSLLCVPLIRGERLLGCFGFGLVTAPMALDDDQVELLRILGHTLADTLTKVSIEAEIVAARKAAEAANAAKSEFLANVSHEIRTPLNAIIGFTRLILDSNPSPREKEFLRKIEAASRTLLATINDVLDFSKIEAGRMDVVVVEFDLAAVVHNVSGLFAERVAEKGIDLTVSLDERIPSHLKGDSLRLEQVLNNLVSNAVKFTEKGGVLLSATLVGEDDDGRVTARFAIRDTGIGILPEHQERLFQPFVQADGSTTRRFGGTGLGLAISRSLVEMMGGHIGFSSEPDRGSEFFFSLPFSVVGKVRPSAHVSGDRGGTVSGPAYDPTRFIGARVLLVDDSQLNQELASELLESAGISVEFANNGAEAVEKVTRLAGSPKRILYDAVLMDIQMPFMDGFEATRLLRDDRRLRRLPIIAMTAHTMARDREKCLEAGMDDYIGKPIDPLRLFSALARWIKPRADRREDSAGSPRQPDAEGRRPPRIDGVDWELGFRRVGSNQKLFARILDIFFEENEFRVDDIRTALTQGDPSTARRFAHTLRSEAGSIGAHHLQECSSRLEQALEEDSVSDEVLREAEDALNSVIDSLKAFRKDAGGSREEAVGPPETQDPDHLRSLIRRLHVALETGSYSALGLLEELKVAARDRGFGDSLAILERKLSSFSMEEARSELGKLLETLDTGESTR